MELEPWVKGSDTDAAAVTQVKAPVPALDGLFGLAGVWESWTDPFAVMPGAMMASSDSFEIKVRGLGTLVPGAKDIDCRAMCVGPSGTMWAAATEAHPQVGRLLHLVSYRPGDKAPRDHGPVSVSNPDFTEFTDKSGKPLAFHGGFAKFGDVTTTKYVILGVCEARGGDVYILALHPYSVLRVSAKELTATK